MNFIVEFVQSIKIIYLILIMLVMIVINIILYKKKVNTNYKYFINGIILIIAALVTSYYSDIIDGIFKFNFLSVKLYIVILIITNVITLITITKNIKKIYKIINYLYFSLISIILFLILILITGTKMNLLLLSSTQYIIALLNGSIIIFLLYLTIICGVYIIENLNNKNIAYNKKTTMNHDLLSPEELLSLPNKENFKIHGVECGIIFEDSIPENIVKNYHILLNDINAKLVNGYTLEENKMLKDIYLKLQMTDINYFKTNDSDILNKISIEEYNFIKKILKK